MAAATRSGTRIVRVAASFAVCSGVLLLTSCSSSTSPDTVVGAGAWGGEHALLTVDTSRAAVEFDCAHGTLPVPITLTQNRFDVAGDYVQEHGGPIREGEVVVHRPARYQGSIDDTTMALTVTLSDTGDRVGSYMLTRGMSGRVFKCL